MLISKINVTLRNCVFIGTDEQEEKYILEDCYIIPKQNIHDITEHFQGVRHIVTRPIFE